MSEKQISTLLKKGQKLYKKVKLQEALEIFENLLKISPEFIEALNYKSLILYNLKRYEEYFQTTFKMNLLNLQKDGEITLDINSPDSWIEEAIKLINNGNNDRALICLMQASFLSPIVNKDGLPSYNHHSNAKIYYYTAILLFNIQDKYDLGMTLFDKANKLDPTLKIPEKIKEIYNDYLSNRSGIGVDMIAPLNASNLRDLFPLRDKILVSTYAIAEGRILSGNKVKVYKWDTHMILSDHGLAFKGAQPVCKLSEYYVPWSFIKYDTKQKLQFIVNYPKDLKYLVFLMPKLNPQPKSGEGGLEYIYKCNFEHLIEKKKEEKLEKIVSNLRSLESLPSYKEYIKNFELVPQPLYKRAKKTIKR